MSLIGTDQLCRPVGEHFRSWRFIGPALSVLVPRSLTHNRSRCIHRMLLRYGLPTFADPMAKGLGRAESGCSRDGAETVSVVNQPARRH
jgi:hypothetical protein